MPRLYKIDNRSIRFSLVSFFEKNRHGFVAKFVTLQKNETPAKTQVPHYQVARTRIELVTS